MDIKKIMNFYELNKSAREIQDRIEKMQANIAWLKANTQNESPTTTQPSVPLPEIDTPDLTPEQIRQQFALRGEDFLDETIAQLNKLQPSQLYENQTQKLPSPPPPKNHEEILRMIKKGDPIDGILLRFQGE